MESRQKKKLAWGLREAATACGVSVPYLRKQIENGAIRPTRAGRRVLITDEELRRWLNMQSEAGTRNAAA